MIRYELTIRFCDEDFTDGRIRARAVLNAFQRAAVEHASNAGLGYDDMIKQNLIWVVLKIRYEQRGTLLPNRDYRLVTYPRPKASIAYTRDYYLYDGENELVIGSSQWCILDYTTRRIVRTTLDYSGEFYDRAAFADGFERIRPEEGEPAGVYRIQESDIDDNDHTNNRVYADMVDRAAGEGTAFLINYIKESRLGDEIVLSVGHGDGKIVTGKLKDGTVIFTAKVG